MSAQKDHPVYIVFLLDSLSGGDIEKVVLNLAADRGYVVDLLVRKMKGALCGKILTI